MKRILGFDVSSSCIGFGALEWDETTNNIKYISSGYLKPTKQGFVIENLVDTRNKIRDIITEAKPDYIGIEEIIQFMEGKSTAKTIITLTSFNRMVCLAAYDYLNKLPSLFSVLTIRHGLKTDKVLPKKEEMPELVAKHLGIKFPYIYSKRGKKKGAVATESYDTADGIAVALYYAFALAGKVKRKK